VTRDRGSSVKALTELTVSPRRTRRALWGVKNKALDSILRGEFSLAFISGKLRAESPTQNDKEPLMIGRSGIELCRSDPPSRTTSGDSERLINSPCSPRVSSPIPPHAFYEEIFRKFNPSGLIPHPLERSVHNASRYLVRLRRGSSFLARCYP